MNIIKEDNDIRVETIKVDAIIFGAGETHGRVTLRGRAYAPEPVDIDMPVGITYVRDGRQLSVLLLLVWLRETSNVFADIRRRVSAGDAIEEVHFRQFG